MKLNDNIKKYRKILSHIATHVGKNLNKTGSKILFHLLFGKKQFNLVLISVFFPYIGPTFNYQLHTFIMWHLSAPALIFTTL